MQNPAALFSTHNPYTQQKIQSYNYLPPEKIPSVVSSSDGAFRAWSQYSLVERKNHIGRWKLELAQRKSELALMISREMGKPLLQAGTEIEKTLQLMEHSLLISEDLFKEKRFKNHIVRPQPLGVIYGIMPWNFPVWQSLRFAVPTLLAGNAVILKPADNVAGSSLIVQESFQKAIDVPNLYQTVFLTHSSSEQVIAHPQVRGVSFTGSTRGGKEVARQAGAWVKKCVLELGGNDAYIVCEDANTALAAQKIYQGRILNSGQSCISAKRLFVHRKIQEDFLQKLVTYLKDIQFGDPQLSKNLMGPLARRDLVDHLDDQVQVAVAQGAQIYYQKELPRELQNQNFFAPLILTEVPDHGLPHFDEFFGPVFSVSTFEDDEVALRLANQSPYGLGGAVFTQNKERAQRLALGLETGSVAINDYLKSSPERPFGGLKNSGYGSELGESGFLEFTHEKVIVF